MSVIEPGPQPQYLAHLDRNYRKDRPKDFLLHHASSLSFSILIHHHDCDTHLVLLGIDFTTKDALPRLTQVLEGGNSSVITAAIDHFADTGRMKRVTRGVGGEEILQADTIKRDEMSKRGGKTRTDSRILKLLHQVLG